jgi:hypothetical protein
VGNYVKSFTKAYIEENCVGKISTTANTKKESFKVDNVQHKSLYFWLWHNTKTNKIEITVARWFIFKPKIAIWVNFGIC